MNNRGFTLIELVIAISILVVVVAIVYACLSSVVNAMGSARADSEEMRLRQFLARSLETNFATVYTDVTMQETAFSFIGENDESSDGPADKVRFCSTAPLVGGMALPGDMKEVSYEVMTKSSEEFELEVDRPVEGESELDAATLQVIETPLIGGNVSELDGENGAFVADPNYEPPMWSVPIRSMDLKYFDGREWRDEWDSVDLGRLPWCVHVRINFAKTEEQLEEEKKERYDELDDPDFELVVSIPAGLGTTEEAGIAAGAENADSDDQEQEDDADPAEQGGERR